MLPGLPLDRGLGYYYFIWPKLVQVVGNAPTRIVRLRAGCPFFDSFTCIKKLYLLLSTNYNHLTTLYPPVNNVLKKYSEQINFI